MEIHMDATGKPVKAILFDIRDTLGDVVKPGHFIPHLPIIEQLLEVVSKMNVILGAIANLPDDVTDEQGRAMVSNALLSQMNLARPLRSEGTFLTKTLSPTM